MATAERIAPGENGTDMIGDIEASSTPYAARITVEGTNKILFDRYDQEEIAAKAKLPKGHVGKKLQNFESQVFRAANGNIAFPGIAFLRATEEAGKFVPPVPGRLERSCKPLVISLVSLDGNDELVDFGIKTWDQIDAKRVTLSRGADTKERPAVMAGWKAFGGRWPDARRKRTDADRALPCPAPPYHSAPSQTTQDCPLSDLPQRAAASPTGPSYS